MTNDYVSVAQYDDVGSGKDLTVLLLHGLGGDREQPKSYLSTRPGMRIIAPDLRAHGDSAVIGDPEAFTFPGFTNDVLALLDHLDVTGPLAVVGVSMGAGIAISLALAEPDRVAGMVLVRPAWEHVPSPANLAGYAMVGELLQRFGAEKGAEEFAHSTFYRTLRAASPSAAASFRSQFDKPMAAQRAVRLVNMPKSVPYASPAVLAGVQTPAVVVGTAGDPPHPLSIATTWTELLPRAKFVEIAPRDVDATAQATQLTAATDAFLATL